MRKVIASIIVSLDGVTDEPGLWSIPYFTEQSAAYVENLMSSSDSLLLGRKTYEGFAKAWPQMEEVEGEFAVRMNTMPKYVVSGTLDRAEWNNSTVIGTDVADEVAKLKAQPGQNLLVYGSVQLTHTLLGLGLLDELHLAVHPVFLGRPDTHLLVREGGAATLEFVRATPLDSGVVMMEYRPKAA